MRAFVLLVCLAVLLVAAGGCQSKPYHQGYDRLGGPAFAGSAAPSATRAQSAPEARMLIWRASLNLKVANLSNAVTRASALVREAGGYVEREWNSDDTSISLTLRVPRATFSNTVSSLEGLGTVQSRNVSSQDVTEEYVDTDARLKNMIALRDRLRELLAKATEVKDLLAIETELGRIQGEIESMEARLRTLKGQVDLSEINLTLTRQPVLGPLGYVFKGLYWVVAKLFVIRP